MGSCGKNCGCKANLSRRDLLKAGAGTAGLLATGSALLAADGDIPPAGHVPPPKEWWDQLAKPGLNISYAGENLNRLIFPLGGIGTGSIWLHGSGRLVNWQIFNNIQKNSQVDDTFFAVRIERKGRPPIVRVLQQEALGAAAGIKDIRFIGQYPIALMRFADPELPADLELEAYNPLIPLDEKRSGLPCAIFTVRAKNKGNDEIRVSILASVQNAVGHAGVGKSTGVSHTTYGGNINTPIREGRLTAVVMSAEPGKPEEFSPTIALMADPQELTILANAPDGLKLVGPGSERSEAVARGAYWISGGDLRLLGASVLAEIPWAVRERGDCLLLSGEKNPLAEPVQASAPVEARRNEKVFAGFDGKDFGAWKASGEALAGGPGTGANPNQQQVTGFVGGGLVNTYDPGDDVQGKLTSPTFRIERKYIQFLVGGGKFPEECCLNLMVGGKVVKTATGQNTEKLERIEWNVSDLAGKEGQLEIVDSRGGGWGHVLVDDIRFSDVKIDAITTEEAEAWNGLLKELRVSPAKTVVNIGKGRAVLLPAALGGQEAGVEPHVQRMHALAQVAALCEVNYRPLIGVPETAPSQGTMCLAMGNLEPTVAAGWEDRDELLKRFAESGRLDGKPGGDMPKPAGPSGAGRTINAAMCFETSAPAGGTAEGVFVLAWHFPHQYYPQGGWQRINNSAVEVGQMYANWFKGALNVARQVITDQDKLRAQTLAFRDAMFDTTLPQYLVDAAAANASIIRGPTCFWTKDDTFYGFEGCNWAGGGCCPMNCNHVWNYEQTLAKLWPKLERNMRVTELDYHQRPDGGIHHRVVVPRDNPHKGEIAVADGQCGAVLKAYREHLQSPDGKFLAEHWEKIKKAMNFAIQEWDSDADGIMDKPQFNTYDAVIFGHNTFISSLYLAALRAAEEMAKLSKDDASAGRYRELFTKGGAKIAETLYDGEYYIQKADTTKLGYGIGCCSDQVVGQWWARILNLGDILPNEQVQSALRAIFRHSMLWTQEGFAGTQRFREFADGRDKGLLICSWPKGGRPAEPILYRDEIWTGVEYQVAGHKLYEGQVDEGLAIVKAARERYDGVKKSPWNEIECGDYYARAMSSWSLLLGAQGYAYDGPAGKIALRPRVAAEDHKSLFTTAEGWGRFEQRREGQRQTNKLALVGGHCELSELRFALPAGAKSVSGEAKLRGAAVAAKITLDVGDAVVRFEASVRIKAGETLAIVLSWA